MRDTFYQGISSRPQGVTVLGTFSKVRLAPVFVDVHDFLSSVFTGKPPFSDTFPDDVDTTSIALTVLPCDYRVAHSILDEMLAYIDADGIIQVSDMVSCRSWTSIDLPPPTDVL